MTKTDQLFVQREGHGPRVVLLHGGTMVGELTWREQRPLAARWTLLIVERAGYGRSRMTPGEDIEADAPLVAALLGGGAHLVGQSSGAVAALLAAARRPEAMLLLTLCEPPAFQLAPASAEAQDLAAALTTHIRAPGEASAWLRGFVRLVGGTVLIPDYLPPQLADGVRALRAIRRLPWELELPIDALAAAPFPKLVISGQHHPAFEAVCDVLAARLGAQRRQVVGVGHSIPHAGAVFNDTLEAFLRAAPAGSA